jgi:hypothetical protein
LNPHTLLQNLISIAKSQPKDSPLQAIFDLDSTLFDVSPRIAKIIHLFAEQKEIQKNYPRESAALLALEPHESDYGVKKTLMRIGFQPPNMEFIKDLVDFWKKGFFSNTYLEFDKPYDGAPEFVSTLHRAGAVIYYLTGRDIPRMLEGTIRSLKATGFPIRDNNEGLILKPNTGISDHEFKAEFFHKLEKKSKETWFFENEPKNIHLVEKLTPNIKIVYVATVNSGKDPEPEAHIQRISGFR